MGQTVIEKILSNHTGRPVKPGDVVDIAIDVRVARDFGGANVVKSLQEKQLKIADPAKTFFTFDCNPTGSDQKYAANQQLCRVYARENGIRVYDINQGIGTHLAIDKGLVGPGGTFISTDSHANILGAVGAFGQGMGDIDVAHAFTTGKVWFRVPRTVRIHFHGEIPASCTAKDLILFLLKHFGADGLLGVAAELYGDVIDNLDLAGRMTVASMATEMGGIIILFPPSKEISQYCRKAGAAVHTITADPDAQYYKKIELDVDHIEPLISQPGNPADVTAVKKVEGRRIDSVFIGSCTNGRYEDMWLAAEILKGHKIAPHVILKIVPATDDVWKKCLQNDLLEIFKNAGALVGNAGCAGCAAGQIGQNGPGEVTVSTGNRNFAGKQGKGDVYLASPATAAASALAGCLVSADRLKKVKPLKNEEKPKSDKIEEVRTKEIVIPQKSFQIKGRVWVIRRDNIDTDMIYHNRHLAVTDIKEMGKYTFTNLEGWENFA
ncbi:3-isopropylmalate dehydratase large subunit, partial [candidate division KSB1 bacterium]|nr:3-isopropylmalate dehydratase large subunit [candidate division KSB1 bacterium]